MKANSSFGKVFNGRGQRVRGLWERNGSYYAQLTVTDQTTNLPVVRRLRLEFNGVPVASVADAVKAQTVLQAQRTTQGELKAERKNTPTFAQYATDYLTHLTALNSKRPATITMEKLCIRRLSEFMGETRIRSIDKRTLNAYMAKRVSDGVGPRTVNIEHMILRNVLKQAIADGLLQSLAIEGVQWLKYSPQRKPLLTAQQINSVALAALAHCPNNGQQTADFIKLMAYSGGRASETLRLRWQDVDFTQGTLTIGADGLAKNHKSRTVEFNPSLQAHLQDMATRKQPDSDYLFPSNRQSLNITSLDTSIATARTKANVPQFTAHLCRHHFASLCLMSGVDVQTVSSWLGHSDGGALLLKTYGHLLNAHRQSQAQRVVFAPIAAAC